MRLVLNLACPQIFVVIQVVLLPVLAEVKPHFVQMRGVGEAA